MNAQALGNCLKLEPVRCCEVGGIFNIIGLGSFRFVDCIELAKGLLPLFRLVPDFNPVSFVGRTSLNNINDVLRRVDIRWTRCSIPGEIVQDSTRFSSSCDLHVSGLKFSVAINFHNEYLLSPK